MIVPIDMYVSSSPAVGHLLLCPSHGKRTSIGKVPILKHENRAELPFEQCGITCCWTLIVSIPHRLGREEATRRLKTGLTRAAASVPVLKVDEERWENDRMIFRVRALGQAASGHLDVADDHVRVEVTLPWLLQRFAEVAQAAIKNRGNLLLTRKS